MSFEDLQALFELEREATKKQKLEGERENLRPALLPSPATAGDYSTSLEYDSAFDTTPAEVLASPTPSGREEESSDVFQTPAVVLRHKRPTRWSTGRIQGRGHLTDMSFTALSPILAGGTPPSGAKSPSSEREPGVYVRMHMHVTC